MPQGLHVLADADALAASAGRFKLLLLAIHPATMQDINALIPLADTFGQDGFGVPVLCIRPHADEQGELIFAHHGAWHVLRPQFGCY